MSSILTVGNVQLVRALGQFVRIVAHVQLAESWQRCRAHPYNEVLVLRNIRRRVGFRIASRIFNSPIGRNSNRRRVQTGLLVQRLVRVPSNAFLEHGVVSSTRSHRGQVGEGIVEYRVGDQSARVIWFATTIFLQWGTLRVGSGIARLGNELVGVEAADVTSVVLEEICELVVEQNRWAHVFRNLELQHAVLGRARIFAEGHVDWFLAPLHKEVGLILELRRDVVGRHRSKFGGAVGCLGDTIRVVDSKLLNLGLLSVAGRQYAVESRAQCT